MAEHEVSAMSERCFNCGRLLRTPGTGILCWECDGRVRRVREEGQGPCLTCGLWLNQTDTGLCAVCQQDYDRALADYWDRRKSARWWRD